MSARDEVQQVYEAILAGWNTRDAAAFAAPFGEDAHVIGFDGSAMRGREQIQASTAGIFADHATGRYVGIVRSVQNLGPDIALLRADSGVVPAGSDEVNPDLNATQALLARRVDGRWHVVLYQNTPAAYHGRPEAVAALTAELQALVQRSERRNSIVAFV